VLASVPGTDQAIEAVLLAQIPRTARVNIKELKPPEVVYQGDPQFEAIPPTSLSRAVNTDKDIIKVGESYYMCYQGVWFVASDPKGPWKVATTVPEEIYKIPASSPAYSVTYVTVVDDEEDEWVTCVAAAGYMGLMIGWGCCVWGSGWYYPPYWWYGGYYPWYYPYPRTYGFSAWYNPYTGTYGRAGAIYGPYGGAGAAAAYNPRTGTYARGAVAYGPYNARGFAQAWNPRTGTYAQTRQGANVYGNWGSSAVVRGDDWARTAHVTNYETGTRTSGIRTSEGGGAIRRTGPDGSTTIGRTGSGDVYAGRDGNVYRRQDGTWQKYENGGWTDTPRQPANRPTPQTPVGGQGRVLNSRASTYPTNQLNQDRAARAQGVQRTYNQSAYRSSGWNRSAGTSFGGMRGGGFSGGGRRGR
jgi:hypothetical protein